VAFANDINASGPGALLSIPHQSGFIRPGTALVFGGELYARFAAATISERPT
jgi:hypothetical protein